LVNYAERHRAGLRVGTSITEGTANFLVNRRMNKSQQMRWSRRGADLLLQVRCATASSAPPSDSSSKLKSIPLPIWPWLLDPQSFDGPVIPRDKQRRTARIPDATVRCGEKSVAMFEIVSPTDGITTELRAKRRRDIKSVDGAQVLVEIEQDAPVIHIHRRVGDFWVYDDVIGVKETLVLEAIAMEIPLSEIYDRLFEGSEPVEDELDVGSADGAS
jgi:hypothetical protein